MPKSKPKSGKGQEKDGPPRSSQGRGSASQPSQSQSSSTQAERAISSFSKDEVEKKVNDLVQFFLIMDRKKLPIKKLDINKHVLKEFHKALPILIEKTREKLLRVFGIELIELEDTSKQKGNFILVNMLEIDDDNPHLIWSPEDNSKTGLLMIILSLIFMNGNIMTDAEMWHALKKFGIDQEAPHDVFGDAKKLIVTEFVRQGYLEYIRQPNTDPATYEFKWGQRAKHETSKRNVLDFVCQIYSMNPEQWTSQYQELLTPEETAS